MPNALGSRRDAGYCALLRQQTVRASFGELALRSNDLDEILTVACNLVGDALHTDLAKVMQLRPGRSDLVMRAGVGWQPGVVGEVTVPVTEATSEGHALKTGQPMISPNIAREKRFKYPPFLQEHGVRAVANVIILGGQDRPPFGILQVDSRKPRQFTDSDLAFLRNYANLLAAAIERLHVHDEVRDREARLRLALDASNLGSWAVDLASGAAAVSPRASEILGQPNPAPPTRSRAVAFLHDVVSADRRRVLQTVRKAVADSSALDVECRITRALDGEVRWVAVRGRAVEHLGPTAQRVLLGVVADITARMHDDAATRSAQKTEAIGILTGGIAHEFNNLLTVVSGNLELIEAQLQEHDLQGAKLCLATVSEASRRAATLTHRLLAFSRQQDLAPAPIDAGALVTSLGDFVKQVVGPGVAVEIKPARGAQPLLIDANQLRITLATLCDNARDAMSSGGRLSIGTADIVLDETAARPLDLPPGHYVMLAVTDTGHGMAPQTVARAFDPFFTTKPAGTGEGLGLSMVYGFVRQSGGQVHIRSRLGGGTTVTIYLPRHRTEIELKRTQRAAPGGGRPEFRKTVLVCDDEAGVRTLVARVLGKAGYNTLLAVDGESALQHLESRARIDLLVTDVGMPGMNGRKLADVARARRPGLHVLFITGYAANLFTSTDQLEPGMSLLTKPFTLKALAAKVKAHIGEPKIEPLPGHLRPSPDVSLRVSKSGQG